MLIAFDPGDTTGVAIFNDDNQVTAMKRLSLDELRDFCLEWIRRTDAPKVHFIVYENFIVFRQKAAKMTGSKMGVSKAIGMIEMLIEATGAEKIVQMPDIKPIATRWSGVKVPSNHSESHDVDAFLHGYYYLRKTGKIKSERAPLAGRKPPAST